MEDRSTLNALSRWIFGTAGIMLLLAVAAATLVARCVVEPEWAHQIALGLLATLAGGPLLVALVALRPLLIQLARTADRREMLALVAQHSDNAVLIADTNGLTEWVNDGFTRITGYSMAEICGRQPGELLHGPATDPQALGDMLGDLAAGHSTHAELAYYHKAGHQLWLNMNVTPVRDADGRTRRYIAITTEITAQKELEQVLRSALKDTSDISNALNQAAIVAMTDRRGVILDANERFCAISGYARDELIGVNHRLVNSGHHPRSFWQELWQTIGAGQVWRGEICNRARDGRLYWVDTTIVPFLDGGGQPERYLAIRFDVTARKALELALRDGEERYRTLIAALAEGIVMQDADGTIQTCNASAEQILGIPAEQIMGRKSLDAQWRAVRDDGSHFPAAEHPAMVALATGQPVHEVTMGVWKPDGSLGWISINAQPMVRPGEPMPYAVVTSFFDITARRRAEEELRFQKTLLECQLETAIDGILVVGPSRLWLYANRRFVEMWGLPSDVIDTGSSFSGIPQMLSLVTEPEAVGDAIEELYSRPDAEGYAEIALLDGRTFERYSAPVRSKIGTYYGRVWYYRDITDRKAVERMKTEFVSMVSHELRTPLTSIRGALGLIAGGVAGPLSAQAGAMVEIALKNSERLIRLINDILDIEKIESGKMSFNFKPLGLPQLITGAIDANRAFAAELGVSLLAAEPLAEVWVLGDADRITQVLTNLISNAAKFSPQGETVVIALERRGSQAWVQVTDRGPGIPDEFRERIFQRFAQADSSNTRRQGGTGLGLSISRAIVERHGGQIGFEAAPGGGTSFFVTLPQWVAPTPLLGPPAEAARPPILVCAGAHEAAVLLSQMLDRAGYSATLAPNLVTARDLLASRRFIGMACALHLLGGEGAELFYELLAETLWRDLPMIVVAALEDGTRRKLLGDAQAVATWLSGTSGRAELVTGVQAAPAEPAEVLYVEDASEIAPGLALLLGAEARLTRAATLAEARARLAVTAFDLLILDLDLPDGSGLSLLPLLAQSACPPSTLIFSPHEAGPELPPFVAGALVKAYSSNALLRDILAALLERSRARVRQSP